MIRINLRRRKKALWLRLLTFLAVLIGAAGIGLGGLYWVDQRMPLLGVWRRFSQPGVTVPVVDVVDLDTTAIALIVVPDEPPCSGAIVQPRTEDELSAKVALTPESATLADDQAGVAADTADVTEVSVDCDDGAYYANRHGNACAMALEVAGSMPAELRLTDLTCRASGEYSMEGTSTAQQPMEDFLRTLEQLPSQVELSWWRSEPRSAQLQPFHFRFLGTLDEFPVRALEMLTLDQRSELEQIMAEWARQAQLDHFTVGDPVELESADSLSRQRRMIWAIGSYPRVWSFLRQLLQMRNSLALNEAVIVPIHDQSGGSVRARLYCRLDYLVKQP